jgi:hypothetical protein
LHWLPFFVFVFQAATAKETGLSQYAGTWAVKSALCGKQPTLDSTFPLVISKDGKKVSNFERSCEVVKAHDQGHGSYSVRSACEAEGDPYFVDEVFKFTSSGVTIKDTKSGKQSEFFRCGQKDTKVSLLHEPQSKPATSVVVKGRCHMDYCDFDKLGKIISQVKTQSGQLIQVQYRSAAVHAPETSAQIDQYADVKVPLFAKSHDQELLMHCSKTRPFAAFKDKTGLWHGLLLNLPEGTAAYTSEPIALFWSVCEGVQVAADDIAHQGAAFSKRGYGNQWKAEGENLSINFESMDDILALANHQ